MRISDAGQRDDVAGAGLIDLFAIQTTVAEDFLDPARDRRAVALDQDDCLATFGIAARYTTDCILADEGIILQARDQQLQCAVGVDLWCTDVIDDGIEYRFEVSVFTGILRYRCPGFALAADRIVDRIMQLRVVRSKLQEKIGQFVLDFSDTPGGFVDLVDDNDRF